MSTPIRVRAIVVLSFLLLAATLLHSQTPTGPTDYLTQALSDLCGQIDALIPVVAMLLVIVAGVVYSAGQFFGAETRARANVWATSCLTGAVIGIIIRVIAPTILGMLAGLNGPVACSS